MRNSMWKQKLGARTDLTRHEAESRQEGAPNMRIRQQLGMHSDRATRDAQLCAGHAAAHLAEFGRL